MRGIPVGTFDRVETMLLGLAVCIGWFGAESSAEPYLTPIIFIVFGLNLLPILSSSLMAINQKWRCNRVGY